MSHAITRLALGSGPLSVNAYLVRTELGCVLVDTGMRAHRARLDKLLTAEKCGPGDLKLIVITHGDADHIGNAAHLRQVLGTPIAMHPGDIGMTRDGDMFFGRTRPNALVRGLLGLVARVRREDRFEPDIELCDGCDLSAYGLAGVQVLQLPGHSSGSVALRFADGRLICGDLLENRSGPKLGSIMDDVPAAQRSVARLRGLAPTTVYPGHGRPFAFEDLAPSA